MVHCYLEWLRICRIATITFKIVETLNLSRITSENKTIHTPSPPLLERLECSTGSSNSGTTLHGGDHGKGKALFSLFEVGQEKKRKDPLGQNVSTNLALIVGLNTPG